MAPPDDERPDYKVYRSRRRLFGRGDTSDAPSGGLDDLRAEVPRPEYTVHGGRGRGRKSGGRRGPGVRRPRFRIPFFGFAGRLTLGFVLSRLLAFAVFWVLFSGVVFLVSAQIQQGKLSGEAGGTLGGAGFPLTSPNTILVLGSDARQAGTHEPGAQVGGPSRSDTILLMRVGAGHSSRLSIPRDTFVDIPGHGRGKINSAYAIGGAELATRTVEQYLGIQVNHLVDVDFKNFPNLIDALGGINIRTGCVISKINGGYKNGGITLRLRPGNHHLDGKRALALARTRKNDCNHKENDLSRARRQQKILAAMKHRLLSPFTFIRLPLVAWNAPRAIRSDMAGPNLLGLFAALATAGTPKTRVLGRIQPDGSIGASDEEKQRAVRRFLNG